MKFLTLGMLEEALFLAFESRIPQLLSSCKAFVRNSKLVGIENLLAFHEEKTKSATTSTLIKAMSQIANFSGKQLRKEDYNNLFKDFETLIKIDDITDLELKDFNGWEINLEQYQRALDLEFEGNFAEAEKIYQNNNIKNDVLRAQNLQKELKKELREGEKYLTLVNINDLLRDFQHKLVLQSNAFKDPEQKEDSGAPDQQKKD